MDQDKYQKKYYKYKNKYLELRELLESHKMDNNIKKTQSGGNNERIKSAWIENFIQEVVDKYDLETIGLEAIKENNDVWKSKIVSIHEDYLKSDKLDNNDWNNKYVEDKIKVETLVKFAFFNLPKDKTYEMKVQQLFLNKFSFNELDWQTYKVMKRIKLRQFFDHSKHLINEKDIVKKDLFKEDFKTKFNLNENDWDTFLVSERLDCLLEKCGKLAPPVPPRRFSLQSQGYSKVNPSSVSFEVDPYLKVASPDNIETAIVKIKEFITEDVGKHPLCTEGKAKTLSSIMEEDLKNHLKKPNDWLRGLGVIGFTNAEIVNRLLPITSTRYIKLKLDGDYINITGEFLLCFLFGNKLVSFKNYNKKFTDKSQALFKDEGLYETPTMEGFFGVASAIKQTLELK